MAMENQEMRGPYNGVAPNPVKNAEFAKALAKALHRPGLMKVQVPMLKIAIGEAAQGSNRTRSARQDIASSSTTSIRL
jgi:NAD dependent epimerase/dehydratase family enzyme